MQVSLSLFSFEILISLIRLLLIKLPPSFMNMIADDLVVCLETSDALAFGSEPQKGCHSAPSLTIMLICLTTSLWLLQE